MAESDGKVEFDVDVPGYLKGIDEMTSKTENRFAAMAKRLAGVFGGGSGAAMGGGSFAQTPVAKNTKEWEAQVKSAREVNKLERERLEIQKSQRVNAARSMYGDGADLTREGRLRKKQEEDVRRERRFRKAVMYGSTGINSAMTMINGGGREQGFVSGIGSIASALAPELAPIFSAAASALNSAFDKRDKFREAALVRYQAGGRLGVDVDETFAGGPQMEKIRRGYGYTINDFSSLYSRGQKQDALGSHPQESMIDLMQGGLSFGNGNRDSLMNLMGAAGKAGMGTSDNFSPQVIGTAIALGVKQGLNMARIGEAADQLADAMSNNTDALVDMESAANRFAFISQMGPQFRGQTRASSEMNQTLLGMSKGNTPFNQLAMLNAAGYGQGKGYAEALEITQRGLDAKGGVSTEQMTNAAFKRELPGWLKADDHQKADILMRLANHTGMSMPRVRAILDSMAQGMPQIDAESGYKAFKGTSPGRNIIKQRQTGEVQSEDSARFGIGGGAGMSGVYPTDAPANSPNAGSSARVMQGFSSQHPGNDIAFTNKQGGHGVSIYSPVTGRITASRGGSGMEVGWGITIQDKTGTTYGFFHLVESTVPSQFKRPGAPVKRGDFLGKTSEKDFSGSPSHLHVQARTAKGNEIDPKDLGSDFQQALTTPGGVVAPSGGGGPMGEAPTTPEQAVQQGAAKQGAVVNVSVTVKDKTAGGIDVEEETKNFDQQAAAPAPGDTPSMHSAPTD